MEADRIGANSLHHEVIKIVELNLGSCGVPWVNVSTMAILRIFRNSKAAALFAKASVLFMALSFFQAPQRAEAQSLYKVVGRGGVITFTSRRPAEGTSYGLVQPKTPLYSRFVSRSGVYTSMRPTPSKYDNLIKEMAAIYKLEPALVKAIVHAESAFNPKALSNKGARGLMQLIPATARRFGVRNSYSPIDNVVGGVRYLRWLFERFEGNIQHVIAGYNAGEGAVDRYRGIPPYSETRNYVRRVMKLRESYRCDYNGRKAC